MRLWTPAAIVVSLLGAVRAAIGGAIIKRTLKKCGNISSDERRARAWTKVQSLGWLGRGCGAFSNRFDVPWRNIAFDRLTRKLADFDDYTLPRVHGDKLPASTKPIFVATLHSRLGQALFYHLHQESQRQIALICSPGNGALVDVRSKLYGPAPIDPIIYDKASFLASRGAFRDGKIVVSCVDYTDRRPGQLFHDIWVATSMFELPRRLGANIVFALPVPNDDASVFVHVRSAPPYLASDELACAFLQFVDEVWPSREPRKVAPLGQKPSNLASKSGIWLPSQTRRAG